VGSGDAGEEVPPEREVRIKWRRVTLLGTVAVPEAARGMVLFAHGSGSSRKSVRNRTVAAWLQRAGFGTLLIDLLTAEEAAEREDVFDVGLLAERVLAATHWVAEHRGTEDLPVGYFGASTGAAAALAAAAQLGSGVRAIVSRGGRPDLAGESLERVDTPTRLIVGERDAAVLALNRDAAHRMQAKTDLVVVAGATHLFEEPGALDRVAELAREWFSEHLRPDSRRGRR
jgi:putative phosphoribosyl transferase